MKHIKKKKNCNKYDIYNNFLWNNIFIIIPQHLLLHLFTIMLANYFNNQIILKN